MARHVKLWARMATVAMILTAVTIAFLGVGTLSIVARLLSDRSAPVSVTPPAEVVEQTPAAQTPGEPTALSQNTEGASARRISASEMPRTGTSPAPHADLTSGPEDSSPSASEQRVFKSRRALETVDPREVVR